MNTVLLILLLIPIAIFFSFIFADIVSNMKRSNNKLKTDLRTVRRDYQQNEQSYHKKRQSNGKVIQMKFRAVK